MQKRTLIAVASAAVLLAGCSHNSATPAPETNTPSAEAPSSSTNSAEGQVSAGQAMTATATYKDNAVSPAELRVKLGTKVSFKNDSTSAIRLSRNPHPSHTGSSEFGGFDTGILEAGKSYEFTLSTPGTLTYHNHFNPGVMGKVVVE